LPSSPSLSTPWAMNTLLSPTTFQSSIAASRVVNNDIQLQQQPRTNRKCQGAARKKDQGGTDSLGGRVREREGARHSADNAARERAGAMDICGGCFRAGGGDEGISLKTLLTFIASTWRRWTPCAGRHRRFDQIREQAEKERLQKEQAIDVKKEPKCREKSPPNF
jgi:hypothetical protein